MKFNLKNRPRPDLPSVEYVREAILWFLGFERELREMLKKESKLEELWGEPLAFCDVIREVLGE